MFSVNTTRKELKTQLPAHLRKTRVGKSHDNRDDATLFKMFSVYTKTRSRPLINSSSFKIVFEKLRFRDG